MKLPTRKPGYQSEEAKAAYAAVIGSSRNRIVLRPGA